MTAVHAQTLLLLDLFKQMNACSIELERIAEQEQDAAKRLEADTLIKLSEERVKIYDAFSALENVCRSIVHEAGESNDMSLSTFIDLCAGSEAGKLQALRREAYQRLVRASNADKESLIYMHATYEATSSILQGVGMMEKKNTYGPGGSL